LLVEDAMKMSRCFLWLACACALGACSGDELSVGDPRCVGAGVRCEPPRQVPSGGHEYLSKPVPATATGELKWKVDLPPCMKEECKSPGSSRLVVHDDGSSTVVWVRGGSVEQNVRPRFRIARYDADGGLLDQDDRLSTTYSASTTAIALVRGANDKAVLAVQSGPNEPLTVYEIDAAAKPSRLFTTERLFKMNAIALDGSDVLVANHSWSGSSDQQPNPELARYRRDGTLVWRQSSLRVHAVDGLIERGLLIVDGMPLVVDARGRAIMVIPEYRGTSIVAVGRDGNVVWDRSPGSLEDRADLAALPMLALDADSTPLLAHGPVEDIDGTPFGYGVGRIDERDVTDMEFAFPGDDSDMQVLALAGDAEGRVLLAAQRGKWPAEHFSIERYSQDLLHHESLAVAGLDCCADWQRLNELAGSLVTSIQPFGASDVYFVNARSLGRIGLPEESDAASAGAAGSGQ
jgi:hypothetical protein